MTDEEVRARIAVVSRWYHPIEIRTGIVTPGTNDAQTVLAALDLPADCHGMRALDLGTRDGFFAFELERRGAEVVAVDYVRMAESGFAVAAELLRSRVTYLHRNLYELTAAELGTFDIDPTNYWGPNIRCVEEMLGETEFSARRLVRIGDRCVFDS